jgi:hypothetical protein
MEILANVGAPSARAQATGSGQQVPALFSERNRRKPFVRACSGCAGDYEDPDRTAWTEEIDERDEEGQSVDQSSTTESLPVPRQ